MTYKWFLFKSYMMKLETINIKSIVCQIDDPTNKMFIESSINFGELHSLVSFTPN
jgi:hypothetical protein